MYEFEELVRVPAAMNPNPTNMVVEMSFDFLFGWKPLSVYGGGGGG